MRSFLKNDIVLIKYPFSDLTSFKVRPAIIINDEFPSNDLIIVPLTSRTNNLLPGEFIISKWKESGLNIKSTVKRGIYTIDEKLILQKIGKLNKIDLVQLITSLKIWLNIE